MKVLKGCGLQIIKHIPCSSAEVHLLTAVALARAILNFLKRDYGLL